MRQCGGVLLDPTATIIKELVTDVKVGGSLGYKDHEMEEFILFPDMKEQGR